MDFSTLLKSLVYSSTSSEFPYEWGDSFAQAFPWSLSNAKRRTDGLECTVFVFKKAINPSLASLARNALMRLKTIRHPDILRYLDGHESSEFVYIATESVLPLDHFKEQDPLAVWGLFKLANVIRFLNLDAKLLHGALRKSSIFVTKAGEFKLGGLELLSPFSDLSFVESNGNALTTDLVLLPPELSQNGCKSLKSLAHPEKVDPWMFVGLVYELYNGSVASNASALATKGKIPPKLYASLRLLLVENPQQRADMGGFLESANRSFFQTDFVQANMFLENIAVKDAQEKEQFFNNLEKSLLNFPPDFNKNKVLPELLKALEFGFGGGKVIGSIAKICSSLNEDDFERQVSPILIKMFNVQDRQMRLNLLSHLDVFINFLNAKTIAVIYPQVVTGFTDSTPRLREATVKSMLLFAPKLSVKTLSSDTLKYLSRLVMDIEPGIRTNTVICVGMLTKYFDDSTRKNNLLPIFFQATRDTFIQTRISSLAALAATSEHYKIQDCATKILPLICTLLIDPELQVRQQALKAVKVYLSRLEDCSQAMVDNPELLKEDSYLGSAAGWAGWAVTSITSKVSWGENQEGSPSTPGGSASTSNNPPSSAPATPTSSAVMVTTAKIASPPPPAMSKSSSWNTNAADSTNDGWDVDVNFDDDDDNDNDNGKKNGDDSRPSEFDGWGETSPPKSGSSLLNRQKDKDKRQAELAKKREERKKKMDELKQQRRAKPTS